MIPRDMHHIVTFFSTEQHDDNFPPVGLQDFIAWLNALAETIPQAFRDNARILIDSTVDYNGGPLATITLYYTRPETDLEFHNRVATHEATQKALRTRELKELARLRDKYGANL